MRIETLVVRSRRSLGVLAAGLAATVVIVVLLVSGGGSRPGGRVALGPSASSRPTGEQFGLLGPPASPPPSDEQFGVNVNRLFDDGTYSVTDIDAQLRAARATGATIARTDALWEYAEPLPPVHGVHRYKWAFDDAIARALAGSGLRWVPIVDYAPEWAATNPGIGHYPPRSDAYFASFAAALAARYGSDGLFWREHPALARLPVDTYEIWNEPDGSHFWRPRPNAGRYAELYLRARAAIRAVDPGARVIVGGLTDATEFLPAMIAAAPELRGHIDGIGIHPYRASPLGVLAGVRRTRAVLVGLGLTSVPLYVTEFGWPTRPRHAALYVSAARRPSYIATTIADLGHLDCRVAAAVLYTWVTPEHDRRNREDWFGISPPSGRPTADTRAFARGIRRARHHAATIDLC